VKDWAKPLLDHVDPYHLGIRFVGFLTAIFLLRLMRSSKIEDRRVPSGEIDLLVFLRRTRRSDTKYLLLESIFKTLVF
jgi:hypothetical protein